MDRIHAPWAVSQQPKVLAAGYIYHTLGICVYLGNLFSLTIAVSDTVSLFHGPSAPYCFIT